MIEAGIYHILIVNRISDHGLYLADSEGNEVLLPNRYVSLADKVGDEKEVFVYHDSEDRLTATTEKPVATVGEAAYFEVVDKTVHGAFLKWGLSGKDLFLPNRNMSGRVVPGNRYVCYVYRDNITGRAVATMSLKPYISNDDLDLKRGQQVSILVASELDPGFRAVIDNRYFGMLYHNQLYQKVSVGDRLTAYVRKITDDNRVDLSLQQEGYGEVKDASGRLIAMLRDSGGSLPVHDDTEAGRVTDVTGMSKKVFKRTAGYLLKRGVITMDDKGIHLKEK